MKMTPSLQRSVETTAPKVSQFLIAVACCMVFAELDPEATEQCHLVMHTLQHSHITLEGPSAANTFSCLVFPRLAIQPQLT